MNEVLIKVGQAVDESGIKVEIPLPCKSWLEKILRKFKIRPEMRVFEIKPLTLGTMYRISTEVIQIDPEIAKDSALVNESYAKLTDHSKRLAHIIALAFTNCKAAPSKDIEELILSQFTSKDLVSIFKIIISQMSLTDFMTSIILIRGINLLETKSPQEQEEIIAPGVTSEQ